MRALFAIVLCLALAAPCAASEPEVFVDPEAPTSKEYAIAFEQARRDAAGTGRQTHRHGAREAPLFGVGIQGEDRGASPTVKPTPRGSAERMRSRREPSRRKPSRPEKASPSGRAPAVEPARAEPPPVALPSPLAENVGSPSALLTIGGLTTGVLLLGAVAGSIVRRRVS